MNPHHPAPAATHQAFGLLWQFPFPFPPFAPAPATAVADVVVTQALPGSSVNEVPLITADRVRYQLPGVACVEVSGGCHIRIEIDPAADMQAVQLLLMGTAAALLLHQRGILPLHGSGIVTPRGAVLFIGHSGAGKSTTLATLLQRGYPLLCDDLAAIRLDEQGQPWVYPGTAVYKLWADAAATLNIATAALPHVRPGLEKYLLSHRESRADAPLPLDAIYRLSADGEALPQIGTPSGAAKINTLLDHVWQKPAMPAMGVHGQQFQRCMAVAKHCHVRTIQRPVRGGGPQQLVDLLEADFLGYGDRRMKANPL